MAARYGEQAREARVDGRWSGTEALGADDALLAGVDRELDPVPQAELRVDAMDMELDRAFADPELRGDDLVLQALRDKANNLPLAGGQVHGRKPCPGFL